MRPRLVGEVLWPLDISESEWKRWEGEKNDELGE